MNTSSTRNGHGTLSSATADTRQNSDANAFAANVNMRVRVMSASLGGDPELHRSSQPQAVQGTFQHHWRSQASFDLRTSGGLIERKLALAAEPLPSDCAKHLVCHLADRAEGRVDDDRL